MRLIQNPKSVVPDSYHGISGSNHKLAAKDATDRGGLWRKRGEGALTILRLAETGETWEGGEEREAGIGSLFLVYQRLCLRGGDYLEKERSGRRLLFNYIHICKLKSDNQSVCKTSLKRNYVFDVVTAATLHSHRGSVCALVVGGYHRKCGMCIICALLL